MKESVCLIELDAIEFIIFEALRSTKSTVKSQQRGESNQLETLM
jgi:hypothetical protein